MQTFFKIWIWLTFGFVLLALVHAMPEYLLRMFMYGFIVGFVGFISAKLVMDPELK